MDKQCGSLFRKEYTGALFTKKATLQTIQKNQKEANIIFVDFVKGCQSINQRLSWKILEQNYSVYRVVFLCLLKIQY